MGVFGFGYQFEIHVYYEQEVDESLRVSGATVDVSHSDNNALPRVVNNGGKVRLELYSKITPDASKYNDIRNGDYCKVAGDPSVNNGYHEINGSGGTYSSGGQTYYYVDTFTDFVAADTSTPSVITMTGHDIDTAFNDWKAFNERFMDIHDPDQGDGLTNIRHSDVPPNIFSQGRFVDGGSNVIKISAGAVKNQFRVIYYPKSADEIEGVAQFLEKTKALDSTNNWLRVYPDKATHASFYINMHLKDFFWRPQLNAYDAIEIILINTTNKITIDRPT